jgi:hypothetical protein
LSLILHANRAKRYERLLKSHGASPKAVRDSQTAIIKKTKAAEGASEESGTSKPTPKKGGARTKPVENYSEDEEDDTPKTPSKKMTKAKATPKAKVTAKANTAKKVEVAVTPKKRKLNGGQAVASPSAEESNEDAKEDVKMEEGVENGVEGDAEDAGESKA